MPRTLLRPQEFVLDGYGQMLVTIFTQISLCYTVPDGFQISTVTDNLQRGLEILADHFPWLAGQVVREGVGEGSTGVFKITPLVATPRMYVKDMMDGVVMPSFQDLGRTGYPMNDLDEKLIAPRNTSSGWPGETVAEVFQLQVNMVKGGIIITFLGQHQCMDGVGQAQVIRLLSKACRGEEFTVEELEAGSRDQPEVMLSLNDDTWTQGPELRYNTVKPPSAKEAGTPRPNGVWCHFSFSAESLSCLKHAATRTLPTTTPYISTDDALSAFVWKAIMRARSPRLQGNERALLARAVDVRKFVGIATMHPGFAQCMTYHDTFTIQQLVQSSLGVVAADLRAAIAPETSSLAYDARSLATLVSRTPDKSTLSLLGGDFDMARDVMINSWVNQNAYELDFGLGLGTPDVVRRPRFDAFQGLVYLLPKRQDGEIGVAVCLSEEDMLRLREDGEFSVLGKPVG
ncbi:putative trichothecene 3-O-acetyltransferase [Xylariaceae sp. FL1019]|nr:putative trichothecene 3-O-acetyltransferase [Xylariaceae sp. FL1019]